MNTIQLNAENGDKNYNIFLDTNWIYPQKFHVCASSQTEALNLVGDYCEENALHNLYSDRNEIAGMCGAGQTVEERAKTLHLTCCGKNGVYVALNEINEL